MEEAIVLPPADSIVKEAFGSSRRVVLEPKVITSTNIAGRAASSNWTKGIFWIVVIDFSNRLSLQVRIPKMNVGKNMKKRLSIMLKIFEINKNPRYTREE
jgi:hypothetical protein